MRLLNKIELLRKRVQYGRNLKINGIISLHGHGTIIVGDNCIITSSAHYNPTDGSGKTHFWTQKDGKLVIGNNVGISNTCITASAYVKIEDNVLIGSGCMLSDTDHHELVMEERGSGNVAHASIIIGKGAFIGARCIILKGVKIGEGAVVGAGSVVVKDIPDREIWAGNPARCIKKLATDRETQ